MTGHRPSKSPSVTAIVLNWCGEDDSAACIASLEQSTYSPLTILLVDNASPDGSGDRLHERFPHIPYIQTGANAGYSAGNNRGIEWALARGSDYVLVINDDAVADQGCVAALVQAAEETGADLVGPQIRYFDDPELVACGRGVFSRVRALGIHRPYRAAVDAGEQRAAVGFVSGCCMLLRTSAVRELGDFDESFFAYVEDAELSLRFASHGRLLVYEPTARVLHRAHPHAPPTASQIRLGNRNRRRLVARHYHWLDRLLFAAWFFPTRLLHLARFLARGDWPRAAATLDGMFGRLHAAR